MSHPLKQQNTFSCSLRLPGNEDFLFKGYIICVTLNCEILNCFCIHLHKLYVLKWLYIKYTLLKLYTQKMYNSLNERGSVSDLCEIQHIKL